MLIQPTFGRLTSYHYHRWQHFVDLGRDAAQAALPKLLDVSHAALGASRSEPALLGAPLAAPA